RTWVNSLPDGCLTTGYCLGVVDNLNFVTSKLRAPKMVSFPWKFVEYKEQMASFSHFLVGAAGRVGCWHDLMVVANCCVTPCTMDHTWNTKPGNRFASKS